MNFKKLFIMLLIITSLLLFAGCADFLKSETHWENGEGELSEQIGSPDSMKDQVSAPPYNYFINPNNYIDKTEYNNSNGQWSELGYGLTSGTKKAGENFTVTLFGHNENGVLIDRDIRIQLTARDEIYTKSKLIMEDIIHVNSIKNKEEIYSNQLPNKENVTYLLSMEILNKKNQVEDTLVSIIYVPTPEINAKLTTDKTVYKASDEEAILKLENFGPTYLSFGKSYTIEKKINERWKIVPLDYSFEAIGIIQNPKNINKQTIEIKKYSPGEYRVVKNFSANGLEITATLATEFTVE